MCGGTEPTAAEEMDVLGLSPRVRGNPHEAGAVLASPGVYPRVCGGTVSAPWKVAYMVGLSPRVRGNRGRDAHDLAA